MTKSIDQVGKRKTDMVASDEAQVADAYEALSAGKSLVALEIFQSLILRNPKKFNYGLGVAHAACGNNALAVHFLRRHERFTRISPKTRQRIAEAFLQTGKPEKAQNILIDGLRVLGHDCGLLSKLLQIQELWLSEEERDFLLQSAENCEKCSNALRKEPLASSVWQGPDASEEALADRIAQAAGNEELRDLVSSLFKGGALSAVDDLLQAGQGSQPLPAFTFWDKETPPEEVQRAIGSWQSQSNLDVSLYSQSSAEKFLQDHGQEDVLSAFRLAHHPAMKSDIFRLARIWLFGGVYVDADEQAAMPIGRLWSILDQAKLERLFCLWGDKRRLYISNHLIAARARDPIIAKLLREAVQKTLTQESNEGLISQTTGPMLFTEVVFRSLIDRDISIGTGFVSKSAYQRIFPKVRMHYKRTGSMNWRNF